MLLRITSRPKKKTSATLYFHCRNLCTCPAEFSVFLLPFIVYLSCRFFCTLRCRYQQILNLASCRYIFDHHNIILMGAAGSGKSYLACAFGIEACKQYFSVRYVRLPDLLTEMAIARGEGLYIKFMKQLQKINLLILDEWMLVSLKESEARDLLEIIHRRHKRSSTIFCSQFLPAGWHAKIGEATLADAILDRIVHDSYTIEIHNSSKEPSMREVYGIHT